MHFAIKALGNKAEAGAEEPVAMKIRSAEALVLSSITSALHRRPAKTATKVRT